MKESHWNTEDFCYESNETVEVILSKKEFKKYFEEIKEYISGTVRINRGKKYITIYFYERNMNSSLESFLEENDLMLLRDAIPMYYNEETDKIEEDETKLKDEFIEIEF